MNFKIFNSLFLQHILLCAFMLISSESASADVSFDSTDVYKAILLVDHMNDDAIKDTLIGTSTNRRKFMPKMIFWGHDNSVTSAERKYSKFAYPKWDVYRSACCIDKVNKDSLSDVILFMWGSIKDSSVVTGEITRTDTAMSIVIFGQKGLDSIETINVESISGFQSSPFIAMPFRKDIDIKDRKIRDLSGSPSYIMPKMEIPELENPVQQSYTAVETATLSQMRLYPNPAKDYTNLEIKQLTPGLYNLKIMNMQGSVISRQSISIKTYSAFNKRISLKEFASGCYMIKLTQKNKLINAFRLIVTR